MNFLKAAIVAFSTLLAATIPAFAQMLEMPSSSGYGGKPISVTGEFKSAGNNRPLVILLHGCSGLESVVRSSLRSHASALRRAGFSTLLLDSFNPRGISGGWVCSRISRLASAQAYRQRDVRDAIKYIGAEKLADTSNVFVMGQSNGGSVASLISHSPIRGVRAAVSYYPWCGAVPGAPKIPLLVLSGEDDDWTPPDDCKRIDKPGGKLSVVTYPGVVHSFDLKIPVRTYLGHKVGGNPKAAADARSRMIAFFQKYVR